MARWHAARTRIQLKLAIQRAHMLQEKKAALANRARLDIAELVGRGRMETARVKTESLILDDIHTELLELLELYCEMLYARFALLELKTDAPDPAIREPLIAVIHAAHHTDAPELHVLQDMLCARYGADFAQAALDNRDGCVSERVTKKLAYHIAPPDLVDAYALADSEAADTPVPAAEAPQGDSEWGALMKRFEALKHP
ncbi:Vacuolar protein sorting-associated protein ist1 [Malassezia caprae]|uniref:Vacuolar protein sorting-associated protein ist1 n=1 Tax=Malassezia caprae TaxID=1381934 RepID=A0AAF0E8K9_9BASI|nr:Vacuolar protein sorting-associated protein ist1 [Malassezia caprae]